MPEGFVRHSKGNVSVVTPKSHHLHTKVVMQHMAKNGIIWNNNGTYIVGRLCSRPLDSAIIFLRFIEKDLQNILRTHNYPGT
jgi:hypothetical protein